MLRKLPVVRVMVVTRRQTLSTVTVKEDPTSPVKIKKTKKTTVTVKKPHFEDVISFIKVPENLELPQDFVDYHREDFIEAARHIINQDASLYRSIVYKKFPHYKKQGSEIVKSDEELILSYWHSLISSVVSQQISGSAARSIMSKFEALFDGKPTPSKTLTFTFDELREVGLSRMKISYVQSISEAFSNPDSNLCKVSFYRNAPLDEVIKELVSLKGIGEWSAKMFALFTLNEWDVFAHDDLGVARGMSRYLAKRPELLNQVKREVQQNEEMKALLKKKPKFGTTKQRDWVPLHDQYLIHAARRFSPYMSVFMLLMWRLSATNIDVLEAAKSEN
ncbi:DNA-3-methyladenine glycosylase [Meyerozyma sp. JA9]|nr:DNA-3-methyladenine glycosylase [Meyerozyma sp. JA9]